ncbi:uncharacterized protein AMSG_12144 [Thecamonas trahens ATCC 50062]|uniref:Uncharacterized protein n=1 Tax=Thecamonas trahens ATCC 50062 TaxID=461836 RepID=A0A0L0DI84_THETB|nr:hypothetical protein AMSG_12144 [Thecamonas trahens ATCC 50062]KNC51950.1 hypothetical protein AMSG_12144 [Thecamonas trahens ATCC 50062]|eukprot:XP_013755629.1 hypothetical protein AMSG_12144 [Thecamonas trahens ATCC 50062]
MGDVGQTARRVLQAGLSAGEDAQTVIARAEAAVSGDHSDQDGHDEHGVSGGTQLALALVAMLAQKVSAVVVDSDGLCSHDTLLDHVLAVHLDQLPADVAAGLEADIAFCRAALAHRIL